MAGRIIAPQLRRSPIPASLAALFVLCSPLSATAATAATWIVNSCDEGTSGDLPSKTGTLRFAAANAANGDAIDMTSLACSRITLKTGSILFAQDSLSIFGPGPEKLTISGKYNGMETHRIFTHGGSGTLYVGGLTMALGYAGAGEPLFPSAGGCIASHGNVTLSHVNVALCRAYSATQSVAGGALATYGEAVLKSSTLYANSATSHTQRANGGAMVALSGVDLRYSTIDSNQASGNTSSFGGGVLSYGNISLRHSTISNNSTSGTGGGVVQPNSGSALVSMYLASSTVSSNTAQTYVGGIATTASSVQLYNSTVAFNTAQIFRQGTMAPFSYFAPGLALIASNNNMSVTLQSSILSNNTYGSSEWDLSVQRTGTFSVLFNAGPANNLVRTEFGASGLPFDTVSGACPLLGSLRDNGGPTRTHMLLSHSPAIDAGNNSNFELFDQRGSGFARVSKAKADIGAYEVDQDDVVFNTNFEACPLLF